jgi:hypothetical protein
MRIKIVAAVLIIVFLMVVLVKEAVVKVKE